MKRKNKKKPAKLRFSWDKKEDKSYEMPKRK